MTLQWRRRGSIDVVRYARIHDGWMTYCAALPADMELSVACADFAATATYPSSDCEAVECAATLVENGREVAKHQWVIRSRP